MVKKLSALKIGESGIIREFEQDDIFLKLMEMGFIEGERVLVEQISPTGDPIAIVISGYKVSLRLDEASRIFVETD